ncbi:MAG: helix-turn-helix domain-containing protein [Kiritimatiellaeota bacterium]|nr:helix-turn-helix domain-containing protein [Kiritimatiellota bacterium]
MPNIMAALKQEITRLARKESRSQTQILKKMSAQYRRDIADLKRRVAKLQRQVVVLEKAALKPVPPPVAVAEKVRFTAKGLASQRKRLGLSAADYAKLVGVAGISIYKWESGKVRPRQSQVAALAAVRGMSKKEALARLAQGTAKAKSAAPQKKTKAVKAKKAKK